MQGTKILFVRSQLRVKSRKDEQFFPKHSSYRTSASGRITLEEVILHNYSVMFFIAYPFKGQEHVFAG